jgi:Phage Mu protein F like protein
VSQLPNGSEVKLLLLYNAQLNLTKARSAERQRKERLLVSIERLIRRAFVTYIAHLNSPKQLAEIKTRLAVNDVQGATKLVERHVVALGRVIPQAFVNVATDETTALAAQAGFKVAKARTPSFNAQVSIGFDASNPRAASLMRTRQLQFVQQVTDGQRAAIRTALAQVAAGNISQRDYTRTFIDSLGLTQSQVDMVNNYRTLLESGSEEALNRELRDRRYDRGVQSAVASGEPIDASTVDRMVDRYRTNMLTMRADTIARTEGLAVVNQARQEAMDQVLDQSGFDRSEVKRVWNATQDSRTRDSHLAMDGQEVGMDEPFVTPSGEELMYPGDPDASAKERINCRCTVTLDFG